MASIKKKTHKDGTISYEIRVSLGRNLNNKQIMKYHTWVPDPKMTQRQIEKAVEREAVLFEEKCRSGQVLDTATKFADFSEKWLETNKDKHSPAYQKQSRDLLVRINAAIGHLSLCKLKPNHLQDLYKNLAEVGIKQSHSTAVAKDLAGYLKEQKLTRAAVAERSGVSANTVTVACQKKQIKIESAKKIATGLGVNVGNLFDITIKKEALSAKTLRHYHSLVSSILETAVKWQVIYDNPARRVDAPKLQKKEAAYLDDDQVLQVAEALTASPLKWRTVVMLLVYSGMRRGEACGLLWDDIDFDNNLIHITKANQYLPELGTFEKNTKNNPSNRVIKLPDEMFALLREFKAWQAEERLKMGDRWQDSGKVFTQENGLPINPSSITGWVDDFRTNNNLPYFTPHSLRHTAATLLIMNGVPVKAVSARLGHADQNITNAVYSHAIQTVDAMASDVIGDVLHGDMKSKSDSG